MSVSTRNIFLAGASALMMVGIGSVAFAGGGNSSGTMGGHAMMGGGAVTSPAPGAVIPGAGMSSGMGSSGHSACCGGGLSGQQVIIPGVNVAGPNVMVSGPSVNVNQGSLISNQQTFSNLNVVAQDQGNNIIFSGGGGFGAPQGVAPSAIAGLNVEGNVETVTEQVPTTEEYCAEQVSMQTTVRPVQAVCLDDKGTPHPASRVDSADRVSGSFNGELFRCMAGTSMQVTLGNLENGAASFAHGETFACRKGEALTHRTGGQLACAPQAPQRSCNERSLLRRHGPGIKFVQAQVRTKSCVPQTRTVMKTVQRERQAQGQPMVFDGGVGQSVF